MSLPQTSLIGSATKRSTPLNTCSGIYDLIQHWGRSIRGLHHSRGAGKHVAC